MNAETDRWCWQCQVLLTTRTPKCPACGSELQASPPPGGVRVPPTAGLSGSSSGPPSDAEVLEIDISGMAPDERAEFLLFMDGSDIVHQVFGYLLVISADDEYRTRELLAAVTQDDLVELDPDEVDENSEWARTVAAMLHPSGRMDAVAISSPAKRIAGAVVSYTMWWLVVVVVIAGLVLLSAEPSFALMVCVFMVPIVGETWLAATTGSSPGKYLFSMRIVSLTGDRPGWRSAVIRSAVLTWPFLLAFVGGPIGSAAFLFAFVWIVVLTISMFRDPGHRGIHDRVAGTRVVDRWMSPPASASAANA